MSTILTWASVMCCLIRAASVVDFPAPVVPATMTSPEGGDSRGHSSGSRPTSSSEGVAAGSARNVSSRPLAPRRASTPVAFTRKRWNSSRPRGICQLKSRTRRAAISVGPPADP